MTINNTVAESSIFFERWQAIIIYKFYNKLHRHQYNTSINYVNATI